MTEAKPEFLQDIDSGIELRASRRHLRSPAAPTCRLVASAASEPNPAESNALLCNRKKLSQLPEITIVVQFTFG